MSAVAGTFKSHPASRTCAWRQLLLVRLLLPVLLLLLLVAKERHHKLPLPT
jgi:hypothetical protein